MLRKNLKSHTQFRRNNVTSAQDPVPHGFLRTTGAGAHGVHLSGNELAALVYCASGQELDGGAVRRTLREPWIATAEPGYRDVFENIHCRACR